MPLHSSLSGGQIVRALGCKWLSMEGNATACRLSSRQWYLSWYDSVIACCLQLYTELFLSNFLAFPAQACSVLSAYSCQGICFTYSTAHMHCAAWWPQFMVADQLWWLPGEEEVQKGVRHPVQKAAGQYLKMR